VVTVTPTYSGCPATSIINLDIETALRGHGIEKLELKRQLSPAWTTDWITEKGRAKLEAYGIAPPQPAGGPTLPALQRPQPRKAQPVRLDPLQGTVALPRLP
jgi:phenylacetate-CoA oxygenase PaaJ subunit